MSPSLIEGGSRPSIKNIKGKRLQNIVLGILWAVCYALAIGYHVLLWSTHEPMSATVTVVYQVIVILGLVALWTIIARTLERRRVTPARTLWTTLLVAVLYLGAGYLASLIPPSGQTGYHPGSGVPLALSAVLKVSILALLKTTFVFILLIRLKDLVLVKRTRSSQRNWYLMLVLMGLAALSGFMKSPTEELNLVQGLAIIPAVGFMVVNSFRLSWIVSLSFKEKMASSGLAFLLLILLLGLTGLDGSVEEFELIPGAIQALVHYSYPLSIFTGLGILFGVLYSLTAFLSLLFHLPTTSDYQRKAGEMATMHSLAHLVGQVFDSERLFTTIAAAPIEACSARASWLAVPDLVEGALRPRIVAARQIEIEQLEALVDTKAFFDEAQLTRTPVVLQQALADHRVTARSGDGIGSLLVTPLVARDQVLGLLFATKEVAHGFETDDIDAISVFASQAALALDNARLFEEQIEKERLERELAIAREVQRRLLPQRLPVLPGITLAASSVSALEVGGDYYDFVRLDEDNVAIIIGDVSGKGTSAAFYMAEMQGIFQSVTRLAPSPTEFLTHANAALAASLERNVFISVVYGVLNLRTEQFVLARAGHCPVAQIGIDGHARYLRSRGLGLGLDRTANFANSIAETAIRLQPGDVFVLYTDGVVESRSEAGEEYGYDRLLTGLAEHRHEDAADLHAALIDDLNAFIGDKEYDDDMTLVVLKWHGIDIHGSPFHREVEHAPGPISLSSDGIERADIPADAKN